MDPKGGLAFDADFVADTSKATAPVKEYIEQVKTLDKTIKEQARSANQQFREQQNAARAAGASAEQLNAIQQKYNQAQFAIRETAKAMYREIQEGNFGALKSEQEMLQIRDRAIEKINQEIVAVKLLADAHSKAHGAEIGGSIAGGAAIRTIDGGQNVRAVENFLAKTLGLGGVFQAIFPIVGAVAALQILSEMGEKIKALHDRAQEAGEELNRMTEDSHAKSETMVADLELQTSKLQDQRDKIAGHPGDGLRTAILEAKKAADEFLVSLRADSRELDQIFAKEHVGSVAAWFSDTNSTSGAEQDIHNRLLNFDSDNEGIRNRMAARMAQAKTPDEADSINKEQQRLLAESARNVAKEFRQKQKDLKADNTVTEVDARSGHVRYRETNRNDDSIKDYGLAAEKLEGNANVYDARNRMADMDQQRLSAEQKKEQERQAKEAARLAKQGSRTALEAQKQAAEEQRRQWDDDYAAWDAEGQRDSEQRAHFWLDRANEAGIGTANYVYASKKNDEQIKKVNEERNRVFEEGQKMAREYGAIFTKGVNTSLSSGSQQAYLKGQSDAAKTSMDLRQAQEDIALAARQASIEFDRQQGTLSAYDAAVQLQQVHTEQYSLALKRLQEQLAAVQAGPEADAQRNTLNRQIVELNGRAATQQMQDQAATAGYTFAGGLKLGLNQFVQDAGDAGRQAAQLIISSLSSVNNTLATAFSHLGERRYHHQWRDLRNGLGQDARQTAGQLATTGLQSAEKSLFGAFGFGGKADGSAANPFSVRIVGGMGSPGMPSAQAIASLGGAGSFSSAAASLFGGFRASGGPVEAGKTYIVGEQGPEPVTFGSSGTMGTARDLQSMMGGGGMSLGGLHIDARGATDPAAVEAVIHRVMPAYIPGILQAGMQMQQDRAARMPSSKR